MEQRRIIDQIEADTLEAVGTDIGEADESEVKGKVEKAEIPEEYRRLTVDEAAVITIATAVCGEPTNNTDVIGFMKSYLGGMRLHYGRYGGAGICEYTCDAPRAGEYQLTARAVTPAWKLHVFVSPNGEQDVDVALPHTVGMWDTRQPVEIDLVQGRNVLTFSRAHYFHRGVTIRVFTLAPVK